MCINKYRLEKSSILSSQTCFWNNEILTPIQKNAMTGPGEIAFKKLKVLLDRMMLRRTKVAIVGVSKATLI